MRHALRSRLRLVFFILAAFALLLIVRLYFVQILKGEEYALRAERQFANANSQLYDRGTIYFTRKDGTLISAATLTTGFIVALNPKVLEDPEAAYALVAGHVEVDREDFMRKAAKLDDPYEVIVEEVPEEAGAAIAEAEMDGVLVIRSRWRTYPAANAAAQTIGFIGHDESDAVVGRYGLERYYEDSLSRQGSGLFGNFFAELFANVGDVVADARDARAGDLVTSIEPVVLQKLDEMLIDINTRYSSAETGGIIMDPKTGEIIALDVVPSFDPNDFKDADASVFGNPLVEKRYEFGSIVKALTMASGIDSGVITPGTYYNDQGCMTLNTKTFCNFDLKARGSVPMQEVLSQSLNMGAAFIAGELGHGRMKDYFTRLGMDTETGIDLPVEIRGTLANLSVDRDINFATASFGQGIAQTPMEMIRALGVLANDGMIVTPHLVTAVKLESGIEKELSWGSPQPVMKSASTATVSAMLAHVVDTALLNGDASIPEMSVAAKTGTAQIANPEGGYYADKYFHSFFGYFPAYEPRFIILLYTREPKGVQYASETLTSSFIELTKFLANYYAVPPDRDPVAVSDEPV
ncbi:MAG: penicillin-binding protein 2 [Candidatus Pacebacteria bacterium]|nr:penicillin-binding protein 2 [Candidatus Paceibacterota bacterium]MBP9840592.1 penicillin-binding protein 2 [Candidatus Paceibacterota bacterium]